MGIHDRDYMRPAKGDLVARIRRAITRADAVQYTLGALIATGLIQFFLTTGGHAAWVQNNLALTKPGLFSGKIWELGSYALLHGDFWHLLFNGLGLWFIGRGVLHEQGAKRYFAIFAAGILAGALAWLAVWSLPGSALRHGILIGASAGVLALLGHYLADKLREEFRILIFFVIPITIEGYWVLAVMGGLSVAGLLLSELPTATGWWAPVIRDNMSHAAHLGGLALGLGWGKLSRAAGNRFAKRTRQRFTVLDKNAARPTTGRTARRHADKPVVPHADLNREVDRILDKINADGFGSLTATERATLEKARDRLKRT